MKFKVGEGYKDVCYSSISYMIFGNFQNIIHGRTYYKELQTVSYFWKDKELH